MKHCNLANSPGLTTVAFGIGLEVLWLKKFDFLAETSLKTDDAFDDIDASRATFSSSSNSANSSSAACQDGKQTN